LSAAHSGWKPFVSTPPIVMPSPIATLRETLSA
jgi:hypothetical protein